jgi:uncharacterized protein (UPF0179 family)
VRKVEKLLDNCLVAESGIVAVLVEVAGVTVMAMSFKL